MRPGDDQVEVLISISNDQKEKSAERQHSCHTEATPTDQMTLNNPDGELATQNSLGNESALNIGETWKIPRTPSISSPTRPEDEEEEEEEIVSRRTWKPRRRKFRAKDVFLWSLNFCILGCLLAVRFVEKLERKTFWGLELWKWCVFAMAIFGGKLLVNWIIHFIVFLMERNFLLKKKALYFVVGLKNSIQVLTWMILVLSVWKFLLNDKADKKSKTVIRIFKYVTRTIISTLIGSFLFLLKRLWLLVLAYDFHINAFLDKIQETVFHQYVLQKLSRPPISMIGKSTSSGESSFRKRDRNSEINFSRLLNRKNVSSWTMKVLADSIRNSPLSIGVESDSFDTYKVICSEADAAAAAYFIFKNVAKPHSKHITAEDLLNFMTEEEVCRVMPIFSGSESEKIDKKSVKELVMRTYYSRKQLVLSMNDIESIIGEVNTIVTWILIVVVIILWIVLMEFIKLDVIVLLLSAAAFMLGNPCKSLFDAIIFVFVVHPFDVGDRCVVDDMELCVEEIKILTTVFLKPNNEKVLYPNSVLANKPISNYFRSPDMIDAVEFSIDFATPKEKIRYLKEGIKKYLEKPPHHWHPQHNIEVKNVENSNKINMILHCHHNSNFQEFGEKNKRRAKLIDEIMKVLEELDIKFYDVRCTGKIAAGVPSEE